jgi:hypothetical protein
VVKIICEGSGSNGVTLPSYEEEGDDDENKAKIMILRVKPF